MARKIKVIAVVGPTASGKTALAIALSKVVGGEVISADSRQIFRGVDLISAKATRKEMRSIPHHMLSIADPKREYSAAIFAKHAREILEDIHARGKVPIVAGGTGFYADALLRGLSFPDVRPDSILRRRLQKKSARQLFAMLRRLDLARARTIERENPVRLIRAIEIARALGKVPKLKTSEPYDVLWIGLLPPQNYEKKIRVRIRERMQKGMLAEARRLRGRGLSLKRMRAMGLDLRHLADLLAGKIAPREFEDRLASDTLAYAKRQMRWFKRNRKIRWLSPAERRSGLKEARAFISC